MAGAAFNEADDTAGLDIIEQVEANGGEYEVIPDETPQGNEPLGGDANDMGEAGEEESAYSGRPRNPDGTFAPRSRQEAQQQEQNRVPISAIQEERRKRQEIERRYQEREREWAVFQGRLQAYQEQQNAQLEAQRQQAEQERLAREQAMMPDKDEDPLGYAQYMLERQQREIENLRNAQQAAYNDFVQRQQQQAAQAAFQEIGNQVQNLQTQFATQNPDYPEAFQYLAQTRYNELQMMGYNEQQIPQILEQERTMIVTGCMQQDPSTGRPYFRDNPARVAYELAKARGYGSVQMGTQPPPQVVQRVQQRQQVMNQASRQPSRTPTEAPLSMESLAKMEESEWGRLMASDPDLVDALMGARG